MKRVFEGTSHLTDNMKAEIRQVNILVITLLTTKLTKREVLNWRILVRGRGRYVETYLGPLFPRRASGPSKLG